MAISLDDLQFLTSDAGQKLLNHLQQEDLSETAVLPLLSRLRKTYSPAHAGAALSLAQVRRKGVEKFGADSARMFFTEDALQQASDPHIRAYRAGLMQGKQVLDVCCGIGADSLAFAQAGSKVLGLDLDPVRLEMARLNAAALDLQQARFLRQDARDTVPDGYDVIFYDPARRDDQGRRIHHVEQYIPPLSLIRTWQAGQIVVKLSPGVDLAQIEPYGGCVEFLSVDGDLKEAVLWSENFIQMQLKATLFAQGMVYHWESELLSTSDTMAAPRRWLIEPDAALIRAGLVQDAAVKFEGTLLDTTIAYFTADHQPNSPWVRAWQVIDWMPFNLKKLRAYLKTRNIGQVTVKKRGSPLTPEGLQAQLKLKGDQSCTLVLTRFQGQPIVIICEDYQIPQGD